MPKARIPAIVILDHARRLLAEGQELNHGTMKESGAVGDVRRWNGAIRAAHVENGAELREGEVLEEEFAGLINWPLGAPAATPAANGPAAGAPGVAHAGGAVVDDGVPAFLKGAVARMCADATAAVDKAREETTQGARDELLRERDEAARTITSLQQQVKDAADREASLLTVAGGFQEELEALRETHAELEAERAQLAEQLATVRTQFDARIFSFGEDLRAAVKAERGAVEKADRMQGDVLALRGQLDEAKSKLTVQQHDAAMAQRQLEERRTEVEALRAEIKSAQAEAVQATAAAAEHKGMLEGTVNELRAQLAALNKAREAAAGTAGEVRAD